MRPLRIAVFLDQPILAGGGYQQALNAAVLVTKLPASVAELHFFTTVAGNVASLKSYGIEATHSPVTSLHRAMLGVRRLVRYPRLLRLLKKVIKENSFERYFASREIDLVYFLSPSDFANDLEHLNYITTVWDLCHRDEPEFPEVRSDRNFESRERTYRSILPKAAAILVDSPLGKANVCRRYCVDPDRVHVMPFSPAQETGITREAYEADVFQVGVRYALDLPYVFYPAQFWPHKNHVYVLEGLKRLEKDYGYRVGAIFAGGDQGNLAYIQRLTEKLELSERVRFAGFVPGKELPYLYRQSLALVMPTYFGPTNLPPLEAFRLGVPVLYPDKAGLRDQVGDAGMLINLRDPGSMAAHLAELLESPDRRDELAAKGREVLGQTSDEKRLAVMLDILEEFQLRRRCWS